MNVTPCGPVALPGTTCTIPATGGGNLLVVGWQLDLASSSIAGITDNAGNTYAEAGPAQASATSAGAIGIWYAKNVAAGTTTLTVTPSASVTNAGLVIWEFSGADTSAPLDQTAVLSNQAASATPAAAAVSTTSANEAVVSIVTVNNAVTGIATGNNFTNDSTIKANGWAHLITSSAGTYYAQWNQNTAGIYASCTVSFKAALTQTSGSACDLNHDGVVNAADAQLAVDMSLGLTPCTANIVGSGICNTTVVNDVVAAAIGGICPTGTTSSKVLLSWTASTSPTVAGYNIYRGGTTGGPYNTSVASGVTTTSYTDTSVVSGQTYYYVARAADASNNESPNSNETQAIIP
ncbi:MAG TPA: fibronectin type III domain-containing protein [Bryobacteraceae bacterium]|nr:fibronectin type III domain-containing protein [Bryobacteraceae bacterium]